MRTRCHRRLGRAAAPLVVAGALMLAAAACATGSGLDRPPGDRASLPASPTALPEFDPASFRHLLDSLHGRPVLVNVWASWCGPCTVEAPHLATLARTFQGRVQFIGVDVQDQRGPARAFIEKYGWPYPSVFDPSASIRNALGFVGQPVTVVYDAAGTQVFVVSGQPSDERILNQELTDVLRRASP